MRSSHIFTALIAIAIPSFTLLAQDKVRLTPDNIDEVVASMTLREKATIVVGGGYGSMLAGVFGGDYQAPGAAGMTRGIERLGIPAIVLSDGPAGVRIEPERKGKENKGKTFYCTGFPIGSMLACTWNTALVEEVGAAIGDEALEYGVDVMLAPGMNLHRNPLCGRNFEYFSEDPVLSGKIAAAYVNGVQSKGVGACVKHFAANNQESNRFMNDSQVDTLVLRKLYLKNFEIAIKESNPWTVMASYNRLNGIHTQMDPWLLTTVLRDEWGYEGLVMTDWVAKRDTDKQVAAGDDLMEPGTKSQINELVRAVKKGEMDERYLDISAKRVLELVVKTPTYKGYETSGAPDLEAHAKVARTAAEEGMVLLRNVDALPLRPNCRVALFGMASYSILPGGTGSGHVHRPYVVDLADGLKLSGHYVDESLAEAYLDHLKKHPAKNTLMTRMFGAPAAPEMSVSRAMVEASVAESDLAVLTIGRQAGEGGDRKLEDDFLLTDDEQKLISDISDLYHAVGKKVVVVLNIGGVIETASWKDKVDAILLAWQPGQEGGNAIADALSGFVNPCGKLAMSFPVNYFDLPSSANYPYDYHGPNTMVDIKRLPEKPKSTIDYTVYKEGMDVGYRYYLHSDVEPSYPFGYGLSYTSLEQTEPQFSADGLRATVTVKNVGDVPGKEVVMIMAPYLRGFAKTALLQPGESQTLTVECAE